MNTFNLHTSNFISADSTMLMIYTLGVTSEGFSFLYHREPSAANSNSDFIEIKQLAEVEHKILSIVTKIPFLFINSVHAMLNQQLATSCVNRNAINLSKALR